MEPKRSFVEAPPKKECISFLTDLAQFNPRDALIGWLIYATNLSVEEVLKLKLETRCDALEAIQEEKYVEPIEELMEEYIEGRCIKEPKEYLFVTLTGGRLSKSSLDGCFKYAGDRLNCPITPGALQRAHNRDFKSFDIAEHLKRK